MAIERNEMAERLNRRESEKKELSMKDMTRITILEKELSAKDAEYNEKLAVMR